MQIDKDANSDLIMLIYSWHTRGSSRKPVYPEFGGKKKNNLFILILGNQLKTFLAAWKKTDGSYLSKYNLQISK